MKKKGFIVFFLMLILFVFYISQFPQKYNPNDINDELCQKILKNQEDIKTPIQMIEIKKINNFIIEGYLSGNPLETKQAGYLIFQKVSEQYIYIKNQTKLIMRGPGIWTSLLEDYSNNENRQYLIVISTNENLEDIIVYEENGIIDSLSAEKCPGLYILTYPENGGYDFYDENNEKIS